MPRQIRKQIEARLGYEIRAPHLNHNKTVMLFAFARDGRGYWDPETNKIHFTPDITDESIKFQSYSLCCQ